MPGLHESGSKQVQRHLHPDVREVLRQAGGVSEADGKAAPGRDADGDQQGSRVASPSADFGLHQGKLFNTNTEEPELMTCTKSQTAVTFIVPGTPVGKGRPKFARRGNFTVAYTPQKTASYENLVKIAAHEAMGGKQIIEGAVAVMINLYVTPPASWSQKKQRAALAGEIFPTSKPDIDNCLKGIMDACNEIVWRDDKQAVDVVMKKRYATTARAQVEVRAI